MILNSVMKRTTACLFAIMMVVSVMVGCGGKAGSTEEADQSQAASESGSTADISNVIIDYKTSEVYTKEDMDTAIEAIEKEFSSWEGCVLNEISYTDDQKCLDNLSYINSLGMDTKYDECIVFTSNFHSPVEGGGAWEADMDYNNWEWYLGRTKGGEWELLTWGY